jgi:hypothetical protein
MKICEEEFGKMFIFLLMFQKIGKPRFFPFFSLSYLQLAINNSQTEKKSLWSVCSENVSGKSFYYFI